MITNNSKIIEQFLMNATVKIFVEQQLSGTGFFITATGYILTAYHCIVEGKRMTIQTPYDGEKVAQLDIDKSLSAYDLAILKVDYQPSHYVPLGLVTKEEISASSSVVTVGYPAGNLANNQEAGRYQGYISRWRYDDCLELSDAIKGKGHSGGLVYHYDTGRVIGVVTDRYQESVMVDAGLASKLDKLFAKWIELKSINQETIRVWERNLQSQKKEEIKHKIFFAILAEQGENQLLLSALREIIEDRWGCQLMTARDRQYGDNSLENIRYHLEQADAFIAEVSQLDGEVMFILGAVQFYLGHVPVVLLAQNQPILPQILQGRRVIMYSPLTRNAGGSPFTEDILPCPKLGKGAGGEDNLQYREVEGQLNNLERELNCIEAIKKLLNDPQREHFISIRRLKALNSRLVIPEQTWQRLQEHYPTEEAWQKANFSDIGALMGEDRDFAEVIWKRVQEVRR